MEKMNIKDRSSSLVALGKSISTIISDDDEDFNTLLRKATAQNPWFDKTNIITSLTSICQILKLEVLERWIETYPELENFRTNKTLAAVLAGNLPMVGFHDMLCAIVAGYRFIGKLSSKDAVLLPYIVTLLDNINPELTKNIILTNGKLENFDIVIATGSNNSSRHFDYYFAKYPHIIRKNRGSVAVLTGNETKRDLESLADDVFLYYGLGCRNVSKLYVPEDFTPAPFYEAIEKHNTVLQHNKYLNNYEYNRAMYLMNNVQHYDNGYCILAENEAISSPIGVVYYEKYNSLTDVQSIIQSRRDEIQCVVSNNDIFKIKSTPFGKSQFPEISDYADGKDTMDFLLQNK